MNQTAYIDARNELVTNFTAGLKIKENEYQHGQFNLVSAALVNYLSDLDINLHEDIYKNILLHKKLSILEQANHEALEGVEMENLTVEILEQLKSKPTIICTFHTGSYRILNLFLASNNIPYSLVIGKDIVEQEGNTFKNQFNDLPGNHAPVGFNIIDAEKPNVGLQMLREIKKGRSLLLYMDGNTGAGAATTKNDNRCVINFLNQQIFARKGIAFLAHAANVPIITVASYRKSWEEIKLRFFDPIYPDLKKERGEYAEEATQEIYNLVAPIVKQYPEQWEAWLYIHKVANIVNTGTVSPKSNRHSVVSEKILLDSFQFGIFKLNGAPILFKKCSYSFYEIDNGLYELLSSCIDVPIKRKNVDDKLFNQLYEQGVLHYI